MRVQVPQFMVKTISQSNPFPGAQINTLTITFSVNTLLRAGARIAISSLSGAMGIAANRGDLPLFSPLDGATQVIDNNFKSDLSGTLNSGSWYDCEKALVLIANKDLSCNGAQYSFSFQVSNPVNAQGCAPVRINVTGIRGSLGYGSGSIAQITSSNLNQPVLFSQSQGVLMDQDMTTILMQVPGAAKGDACAMRVWPAAFLHKSIGQSSPSPCAVNTITVTISSNVPLPSSVQYTNAAGTIYPYIVISRVLGAQIGEVGVAPAVPKKADVGPNVLTSSNNSKTIALLSSDVFVPSNSTSGAWSNDPTLFQSGIGVETSSQAVWNPPNSAGESSVQIYVGTTASKCSAGTKRSRHIGSGYRD